MAQRKKVKKNIRTWRVDKLKPNSMQNVVITDVDDATFQRLLEDLAENGQIDAIEITPDGEVIDGHQRLRAAIKLGWKTLKVWIRDDLKTDRDVSIRFVQANLNRRQMSKLDKARAYIYMRDLERQKRNARRPGESSETSLLERRGDLRDELGKMFNCKGRTLDRWARVLKTPLAVQQAFDRDELTQDEAGRVAGYGAERQTEVARRIEAGENAKAVVRELAPDRQRRKACDSKLDTFFKHTRRDIHALEADPDATRECLDRDHLPKLRKIIEFASGLAQYIEDNPDKCRTEGEYLDEALKELDNAA